MIQSFGAILKECRERGVGDEKRRPIAQESFSHDIDRSVDAFRTYEKNKIRPPEAVFDRMLRVFQGENPDADEVELIEALKAAYENWPNINEGDPDDVENAVCENHEAADPQSPQRKMDRGTAPAALAFGAITALATIYLAIFEQTPSDQDGAASPSANTLQSEGSAQPINGGGNIQVNVGDGSIINVNEED